MKETVVALIGPRKRAKFGALTISALLKMRGGRSIGTRIPCRPGWGLESFLEHHSTNRSFLRNCTCGVVDEQGAQTSMIFEAELGGFRLCCGGNY